jgi:hypothetical protein
MRSCGELGRYPVWCETRPGLILDETVCEQHLLDALRDGYREGLSPLARVKGDDVLD